MIGVGSVYDDGADHGILLCRDSGQGDGDEAGNGGDVAKAEEERLVRTDSAKHIQSVHFVYAVDEDGEETGSVLEEWSVGFCKHQCDGVRSRGNGDFVLQIARGGVAILVVNGLPCA